MASFQDHQGAALLPSTMVYSEAMQSHESKYSASVTRSQEVSMLLL